MGRNPENNKRMLDERNTQILDVAVELFARRGLSATRIQDIAELAGISQGLVYHYYKSKEDIFVTLIQYAFQSLNNALDKLEQLQLSPKEKIRSAVVALLQGFKDNKKAAWYHMLIAQAGISDAIPDEAKKILESESRKPYEVMARIITAGQNDSTIGKGDAGKLALVFWTLIKGFALHIAVHGDSSDVPGPEIVMKVFE
jgi:AcrR family transcriptional regulator